MFSGTITFLKKRIFSIFDWIFLSSWNCRDKRYLIRKKNSGTTPAETIATSCTWYKNYTLVPDDLECILTYCSNATTDPNTNQNYNLVLGGNPSDLNYLTLGNYQDRTPLTKTIFYPCVRFNMNSNYYRLENLTDFQYQADGGINVTCGFDGLYKYPATWPQCSANITCQDPGITTDLLIAQVPGTPKSFYYLSQMAFTCVDKRKYMKISSSSSSLVASITTICLWRKQYNVTASQLTCSLHHCAHPYNDNGSFVPPPLENNLVLVEDYRTASSFVPYSSYITFNCSSGTYIETSQTDPTQTQVFVQCLPNVATYNIPTITNTYVYNTSLVAAKSYQPGFWPNCTSTVKCGQPPAPPVNGSITWMNGITNQVIIYFYFLFYIKACLWMTSNFVDSRKFTYYI